MVKQVANSGRQWYVIHTYSGYEDAVKDGLLQRIDSLNMQDYIFDVVVPKEKQIVMKKGQPVEEDRKIFPGYVLVNMLVTDESWYVVRNTPNVTGFVGAGNIPVPVSPDEWNIVEKQMGKTEVKFDITVSIGDPVTVLEGPFANYEANVEEIDEEKGKIRVLITIFGRETPVELDFNQVKKR